MMLDSELSRDRVREKVDAQAKSNLFDYLNLMHSEIEPAQVFEPFAHTMALARAFQRVATGECRRLLVAVPPRFGKSLAGSIGLPTWLLGQDPSMRIVCGSYSEELSRDFAVKSRAVMQSPLYRRLFPNAKLAPDGQAHHRLTTTKGGYRLATSVGGAMTGKGADLIIVDDPLKAKDAIYSQAARDEAYNWINGTLMSRFDKPAEGRFIVIGQRLHTDDLFARLRDDGGWEMLVLPAEAQVPMELDIGAKAPWRLEAGDLLFPERFGHDALKQLRHELGEANYAAQILQDPQALGGTVFKVKDFVSRPAIGFKPEKMEAIYQSWDTAISEDETAAWSVCTTWGVLGKKFLLMDVFRERLTYPALLKAVRAQYDKHKPRAVFVEYASSGQALFQQLRQEGCDWIYKINPKGSKQERAMYQAPKVEQGRVHLPERASWFKTFIAEVASFPLGRSDQVDSMTQFLHIFDSCRNHLLFRELTYWKNQIP